MGWLEGKAEIFGISRRARCQRSRLVLAPLAVRTFHRPGQASVPLADGQARVGCVTGGRGKVPQATVVAEPGPRSPRFPASKFRVPKLVPQLVRRSRLLDQLDRGEQVASP